MAVPADPRPLLNDYEQERAERVAANRLKIQVGPRKRKTVAPYYGRAGN